MRAFRNWSIRTHLILLVSLAVGPALAIIIYTGFEQQKKAIEDIHSSCTTLVNALADDMENSVTSTRQMLETLATLPELKNTDGSACTIIFADILKKSTQHNSLQAFSPDGEMFASAIAPPGPVNVRDRKYFRDALKTRRFSTGEYIIGRTAKKAMINFASPVFDNSGKLAAVVQAGIDLSRFDKILDKSHLPPGSLLIITDHKGTILHHSENPSKLTGTEDHHLLFSEMKEGKRNNEIISRLLGDTHYLLSYKSLSMPDNPQSPYIYMRLQVPESVSLEGARNILNRNLIFLAVTSLLSIIIAIMLSHFSIINPANRLVRASQRLADGETDATSGLNHDAGEFGQIAQAFDRMAGVLVKRAQERENFITELHKTTSWALDEKSSVDAIIASIGDGISIQDREYRVIYQNDVHRNLVGSDCTGRLCYEVYEHRSDICTLCPLAMSFTDGEVHTVEKEVIINEKQTWLMITASPVLDSSGEIVKGIEIVKDITSWKLIEKEREQMNRKLADSNRELEHFAYIASHDLQEPLRTITSFIQLLAKRYKGKLDNDADEFISFITDGAHRMQQLINDLLSYSRVESKGRPFTSFQMESALQRTVANLRLAVAESGAVITNDPLPQINGDETQIVQLLQNLIANAIKFHGSEPPRIHLGCCAQTMLYELRLQDNGIGIAPEFFERVFEIFQRLHSRKDFEGTGIGLAVCRKIVERHGGTIRVESEPGKGSVFIFTLLKQRGDSPA